MAIRRLYKVSQLTLQSESVLGFSGIGNFFLNHHFLLIHNAANVLFVINLFSRISNVEHNNKTKSIYWQLTTNEII